MNDGFRIEEGTYGPRMVLTAPWSDSAAKAIGRQHIDELELNHAKGWEGTDLSFLSNLNGLLKLDVLVWGIDDISDIHHLTSLRSLKLDSYCNLEIDFACFPILEECALEWRPRAKSLFKTSGLKKLFINHYPKNDFTPLSLMTRLESLTLKTPRLKTLDGIEAFQSLKSLWIAGARGLQSMDGIEALANLKRLHFDTCRKITDLSPVATLANLTYFRFANMNDVESIKPLSALVKLEEFHFYESTNVLDGDLSPLLGLPNLRKVSFKERRHYSNNRLDFPQG